jgi:hypothetical protein
MILQAQNVVRIERAEHVWIEGASRVLAPGDMLVLEPHSGHTGILVCAALVESNDPQEESGLPWPEAVVVRDPRIGTGVK